MELMLIVRVLLRRWWAIVIPVAIVSAFSVPDLLRSDSATNSGGWVATMQYSAVQALNLPERDGDYQDVWLASEFVVNAFTDWVSGSRFRDELARSLGDGEALDLNQLAINADNDRSIGLIQLVYPTEAGLQRLADATIDVLSTRSHLYFGHLGGEPAEVTLLDEPVPTPLPPSLPNRLRPLIQIGLAFAAGILLAFLIDYLDPTLRRRDELEALGVPVMATVPRR